MFPDINVELVHPDAKLPEYATEGDSGADLFAVEDILIDPMKKVKINTGIRIEIPKHPRHDEGYRWEIQIRPRSGVASRTSLYIPNSPGTIDNFFIDCMKVLFHNVSPRSPRMANRVNRLDGTTSVYPEAVNKNSILIKKGERFAQIVFNEVVRPKKFNVCKIDEKYNRGSEFGGTGV